MGKATLDLPDPLQSPPPGSPTSTDDLLAQLAGEEIDRLLSEADSAEAPAAAPAAPTASRAPVPSNEPTPDAPAGNGAVNIDAGAPAPPEPEADVAAELDELFNTAVAKDKADEEAAAALQAADASGVARQAGAGAEVVAAETSPAERAGLTVPVRDDASGGAGLEAAPQPLTDLSPDDRPTPLYLRPLEWLNAPLAACPASVRDLVGKAAIITLFNAAAIIVYVLLFRRG